MLRNALTLLAALPRMGMADARGTVEARLGTRLCVATRVLHADGKCVWFGHDFHASGTLHAQLLVKMKFKHGGVTVPSAEVLGSFDGPLPEALRAWDNALAQVQA